MRSKTYAQSKICAMNSCNSKNNLLFVPKDEQSVKLLYKHCLEQTRNGKIVLLLTGSTKDLLPVLKEAKLNEHALKRFVIITLDTIDECIQKLCEQHDWAWLPALIIVDMRTILINSESTESLNALINDLNRTEATANPISFFQQLPLTIANLLGYHQSVERRFENLATTSRSNRCQSVFSVLIINEYPPHLTREQINLIVNLYYYKHNAFDEIEEIINEIVL